MRLYEEIFKDADGVSQNRCIIVPDGGGYFEGVKGVEDFSSRRIILRFSCGQVALDGKSLSIKKYCDRDLEIHGQIQRFYYIKAGEALPPLPENTEDDDEKRGEEKKK